MTYSRRERTAPVRSPFLGTHRFTLSRCIPLGRSWNCTAAKVNHSGRASQYFYTHRKKHSLSIACSLLNHKPSTLALQHSPPMRDTPPNHFPKIYLKHRLNLLPRPVLYKLQNSRCTSDGRHPTVSLRLVEERRRVRIFVQGPKYFDEVGLVVDIRLIVPEMSDALPFFDSGMMTQVADPSFILPIIPGHGVLLVY